MAYAIRDGKLEKAQPITNLTPEQKKVLRISTAKQGGRRSTQFLSEMKPLILYDVIERVLIEKGIYKPNPNETTICKFRNALIRENFL